MVGDIASASVTGLRNVAKESHLRYTQQTNQYLSTWKGIYRTPSTELVSQARFCSVGIVIATINAILHYR
jgi:hypothetical protein